VAGEQTELLSLEMVSMPAVVSSSSHQEKEKEGEMEGGGGDVRQLVDQMTVNFAKFRSLFFSSVKDFGNICYQSTIESYTSVLLFTPYVILKVQYRYRYRHTGTVDSSLFEVVVRYCGYCIFLKIYFVDSCVTGPDP
jgi:hypothetical protein